MKFLTLIATVFLTNADLRGSKSWHPLIARGADGSLFLQKSSEIPSKTGIEHSFPLNDESKPHSFSDNISMSFVQLGSKQNGDSAAKKCTCMFEKSNSGSELT